MSDPRWDRVKDLFAAAITLAPGERDALLSRECATDAELRREVESLLRAHRSSVGAESGAETLSERPGTRIGPYKLIEEIGEGGFGVVFLAEQESPVRRRVALKVIKPGMGTRQIVARFEQERQALALMDHPNIARVFDAGATETGRPYFVMELVSGDPIVQYCDKNRLPVEERLEVFAQVCIAVQHAHGKGLIHRDIKPSNILVGTQDGRPVAKVIDFGIAKATSARLTDKTIFTEAMQVIGTLQYMSPEQAQGSLDIDTRSDVYALGVVLYELLTGSTPFDPKTMRNAMISEIQRMIVEDEPPRPSTRLRESADLLASIAEQRRVAPGRLGTLVHGELDWIVMKALEKDRTRRYETADGLAADVRRHLAGEAVSAAPPSTLYLARKFVRRNKGAVSAAAVVAAALVLGMFGTLWQAARAVVGEREAQAERIRADNEAEVVRRNLYDAQMHVAQQAWREHRGLTHMRQLLGAWLPDSESLDRRGWEWFYLNALPYQNLRTLVESGPDERRSIVAWHVASGRLAEGTVDGLVRIWDVDREQTTLLLRAPAPVALWWGGKWLAWSPDGGKLAAGCSDGTVHLWETSTGRELRVLPGNGSPICAVAFNSDGTRLASWGTDGAIEIRHAETGRLISHVAHPSDVTAGAWSPDDKLLAAGHEDGTVTLSGLSEDDKLVTLRGGAHAVCQVAWSPDGTRLASAGEDFVARIWDVAAEQMVLGPLRHSHGVTSVVWEPNGQRLATGGVDQTVKVWNTVTGQELLAVRGYDQTVCCLSWGPDGFLAAACNDGSVKVCTWIHDQEASVLEGHVGRTTSVAWSPDGTRLASGGDDGKIRVWDPATRRELSSLQAHDVSRAISQFGLIRSLAWSPDGTRLASAGLDGTAKVWDVASGRELCALPADRGSVWAVTWSPDGTRLAAGSEDGTIRVVEGLDSVPKVHQFQAHQSRVRSLAWSPKGDRLASGGMDRLVKLWDPVQGIELARMAGHEYHVIDVAWSPDGKQLASASGDFLVMSWDAASGERLATMRGHNDWVDAVAWSPDGSRLASAGIDNSVRVWDPRTGEEAFVLRGAAVMFHDVSWSPDGAQLAAASSDGLVWVWDATRGFERDTTARAWPFIDRRLASGTARHEDRLAYAALAIDQRRFALAGRLWAEALEGDSTLGDNALTQPRYQAARAALLAAAGQDRDEPRLDEAAKSKLRRQALDWLSAELKACSRILEIRSAEVLPNTIRNPRDWKQDGDLAGVRDAVALARLPADEQNAFARFWADVDAWDVRLLSLESSGPPSLETAALQAWFGQDKELAATCERALWVARDTSDPATAERSARMCSLRPSDGPTHEAALLMARRAVELRDGNDDLAYFQMGLGMAEYRCAHFAAADAALLEAARPGNDDRVALTASFYRAMSLFRQGKEAEAWQLAAEAAARMKPLPADEKDPLAAGFDQDDLIAWMASREAQALIGFEAGSMTK